MQQKQLHILISQLDWGLGHASRCIPVIRKLTEAGHKVTLAGYGRSLVLLQKEFPLLESIGMKGFSPSYPRSGTMTLHMFLRLPQFIYSIVREHFILNKLIAHHHFDCIISDNRYGLWNKKLRSILIVHQVMIKTPNWPEFAEKLIYKISYLMISRFDECWIPDYKDPPALGGDLSHKYPLPANARFIGPLSRFHEPGSTLSEHKSSNQITAVISGPEPQRSIFENLIMHQLKSINLPAYIVEGKPESDPSPVTENDLTILPHLNSNDLHSLLYVCGCQAFYLQKCS